MVEVTETDNTIIIKLKKRSDLKLDYVYNVSFFYSLGLDVVSSPEEIKGGGLKDVLDKSENAIDQTANFIEKKGDVLKSLFQSSSSQNNEYIEFVLKKNGTNPSSQRFDRFLQEKMGISTRADTFLNSGIDCVTLENITNDLCGCLDIFRNSGYRISKKMREMIYVINGRFLFLTEDIEDPRFHENEEEENILKLLTEICGKDYVRGEERFMEIRGTMLYKRLTELKNL